MTKWSSYIIGTVLFALSFIFLEVYNVNECIFFRKSTNKKRKAIDTKVISSSKKSKNDGKYLKKEAETNEKKLKKRKRPPQAEEKGKSTFKKSTKRPRIGNLECGRFPKAFAVQVSLLLLFK